MNYPLTSNCPDSYLDYIGFIDDEFKPIKDITISPFDRGYLFGDSVYEVVLCLTGGSPVDLDMHLERLQQSLELSKIDYLTSSKEVEELKNKIKKLILKNLPHYPNQSFAIYIQINRNQVGPRNHVAQDAPVSILMKPLIIGDPFFPLDKLVCKSLLTQKESRWAHPCIKTTMLLPNILAKKEANDQGFQDALFIDNDIVLESTSSNIFVLTDQEEWVTPSANGKILNGITRQRVIKLYQAKNQKIIEREITEKELANSLGACLSSSTITFQAITKIDHHILNQGKIHPKVLELIKTYQDFLIELVSSKKIAS